MNNLYTKRTWAEIDLDAIAHNFKNIRSLTDKNAKVLCVVKADAYGHGFYEVAKTLQSCGADAFAVATFEEAKLLRDRGFEEIILILGHTDKIFVHDMIKYDISATVFDYDFAKAMSDAAVSMNKKARFHIKIDTGMSRIGFGCLNTDIDLIEKVCSLPNVVTEGIFTHFACADEEMREMSDMQFKAFSKVCDELKSRGIEFTYRHICNSAGIIQFPEYHLDMVRPGIILYGCYPSNEVNKDKLDLIPAMTVKARITRIDTKPENTPVSYGATYKTEKETKIATVPIGYADGYLRSLSENALMTAKGKKVPVVGRICMDQCMIDVSSVNNINVGDEVTVFGNGGDSSVTAAELAENAGTISYELLCAVGNRTPRIYLKCGKIIDVLTYLG